MPLTPISYAMYAGLSTTGNSAEEAGTYAAWTVARHYNASHLDNKKMLWWHLSGAALTIWLTRNWTPDQVLSKAAEITRQRAVRKTG